MTPSPSHLDHAFIDRLQRSYRLALDAGLVTTGIWSNIDARRRDVHQALLAKKTDDLRAILADPITTDLFYGVDNLCRTIMEDGQRNAAQTAAITRGELLFVAELLQVKRSDDLERALSDLDIPLQQHIEFPTPFRGEHGITSTRGVASHRAIQALYQAWLLLTRLEGIANKSVVEIGPGMGRTAYYAYRAGVTDYTTIDLPLGVVAQACFLGAVLGPDSLWLLGDEKDLAKDRIKLLPSAAKPERNFGIALNVDSLPEMPPDVAFDHVVWIGEHAEVFLSINHLLGHFSVAEVAAYTLGIRAKERRAYAMRDGYVEELYVFGHVPEQRMGGLTRLRINMLRKSVLRALSRA